MATRLTRSTLHPCVPINLSGTFHQPLAFFYCKMNSFKKFNGTPIFEEFGVLKMDSEFLCRREAPQSMRRQAPLIRSDFLRFGSKLFWAMEGLLGSKLASHCKASDLKACEVKRLGSKWFKAKLFGAIRFVDNKNLKFNQNWSPERSRELIKHFDSKRLTQSVWLELLESNTSQTGERKEDSSASECIR